MSTNPFTRIRVIFDESVQLPDDHESIRRAVVLVPGNTRFVSDLEHLVRDQYAIQHSIKLELEGGFFLKSNQDVWFVVKENDILLYVSLLRFAGRPSSELL